MMKSFLHAFSGIVAAVRGERNMRIHVAAALAAIVLGAWLGLDGREWAEVVICIALVMSLECLNTAVESVVDLASPGLHPLAKKAKDCAAGAVLVAAIGAAVVGCIVFGPKLLNIFRVRGC
ncbi:MAG: diacylglycerol kinase family protein [Kiritimatiellae bacterium]|nr:diacylglycerol kinase family protein [Kiritimatiellia bacterium]